MSDIERLFLAAYPLWPKALLEKFSSLLSFEVAKFNPEINQEIIKAYIELSKPRLFSIVPDTQNDVTLLAPNNASHVQRIYFGKEQMRVDAMQFRIGGIDQDLVGYTYLYRYFFGSVSFDQRIFDSVLTLVKITYENTGVYEYINTGLWTSRYEYVRSYPVLQTDPVLKKYEGAKTALAMIENGVSVDVNQKLLDEFVTFLNAYNKYSGELAAANSLQAEKNRQTMTDYNNSISEKLNSRKNELNDLRTQISFAAKNETASAKRDMQNLTLSAQSLMLQLQDKLK